MFRYAREACKKFEILPSNFEYLCQKRWSKDHEDLLTGRYYRPTYGSAPRFFPLCTSGGPHKNCLRAACGLWAVGCPPLVYTLFSYLLDNVMLVHWLFFKYW